MLAEVSGGLTALLVGGLGLVGAVVSLIVGVVNGRRLQNQRHEHDAAIEQLRGRLARDQTRWTRLDERREQALRSVHRALTTVFIQIRDHAHLGNEPHAAPGVWEELAKSIKEVEIEVEQESIYLSAATEKALLRTNGLLLGLASTALARDMQLDRKNWLALVESVEDAREAVEIQREALKSDIRSLLAGSPEGMDKANDRSEVIVAGARRPRGTSATRQAP